MNSARNDSDAPMKNGNSDNSLSMSEFPFLPGFCVWDGQRFVILLAEPRPCRGCGEPHTMFIHRDARTVCCDCDAQRSEP